jgi:hypothetical protein
MYARNPYGHGGTRGIGHGQHPPRMVPMDMNDDHEDRAYHGYECMMHSPGGMMGPPGGMMGGPPAMCQPPGMEAPPRFGGRPVAMQEYGNVKSGGKELWRKNQSGVDADAYGISALVGRRGRIVALGLVEIIH